MFALSRLDDIKIMRPYITGIPQRDKRYRFHMLIYSPSSLWTILRALSEV
mgnify:CR=1 FL=1